MKDSLTQFFMVATITLVGFGLLGIQNLLGFSSIDKFTNILDAYKIMSGYITVTAFLLILIVVFLLKIKILYIFSRDKVYKYIILLHNVVLNGLASLFGAYFAFVLTLVGRHEFLSITMAESLGILCLILFLTYYIRISLEVSLYEAEKIRRVLKPKL